MRPGLTLAIHFSTEPLPEPIRTPSGFWVKGRSGKILIHTLPPHLTCRLMAIRADSICVKSPFPTLFMHGGTSVIAVDHVAESIFNCFEKEIDSGIYALGSKNLTWNEFIWKIHPTKKIIHIPLFCLRILGCFVDFVNLLKGRESGLKMKEFAKLQVKELFLDIKSCSKFFEDSDEVLDSAFEKMINES